MNFGEQLRLLRKEKGYTQAELGKLTNQTIANISRYELGIRQPSIETIKQFADFFNVSLNQLLGAPEKDAITETATKSNLTKKDEKDIARDVEKIMMKLDQQEDGPVYYNGEELGEDDKELFKDALELALRNIKIKNKEKYTPKKYKK